MKASSLLLFLLTILIACSATAWAAPRPSQALGSRYDFARRATPHEGKLQPGRRKDHGRHKGRSRRNCSWKGRWPTKKSGLLSKSPIRERTFTAKRQVAGRACHRFRIFTWLPLKVVLPVSPRDIVKIAPHYRGRPTDDKT